MFPKNGDDDDDDGDDDDDDDDNDDECVVFGVSRYKNVQLSALSASVLAETHICRHLRRRLLQKRTTSQNIPRASHSKGAAV